MNQPDEINEEPMPHADQVEKFSDAVKNAIYYYTNEFHLSDEDIVGTLEIIKHDFISCLTSDDDDGPEFPQAEAPLIPPK